MINASISHEVTLEDRKYTHVVGVGFASEHGLKALQRIVSYLTEANYDLKPGKYILTVERVERSDD